MNWSDIGWILSHFGIASLAMVLLEMAHRRTIAALTKAHEEQRSDDAILVDVLQATIEMFREQLRREERS